MAKKPPFNILSLWPIGLAIVGFIVGYTTLGNAQANDSKRIDKLETKTEEVEDKYHEFQLEQKDIKSKVDQGYALLQEIRQEMKAQK